MKALDIIHDLMNAGENLSRVIVKTDSEYLSKGLCQYVWKWTRNGYKNWKGQPVVNGRAFKYLHERVELLEREYGIVVSFCLVPRRYNEQADHLARAALN
jgi:ribonuclease HI